MRILCLHVNLQGGVFKRKRFLAYIEERHAMYSLISQLKKER